MRPKVYDEIVQRNAKRWEVMAKHRQGMTIEQHLAGESALDPTELDLLGDLDGKRVLHLACSTCDEGITMAMRGASVVGIDISETHVEHGRYKIRTLEVDVTLHVGDMMKLDQDLRDFDIVYISSGGICWVPDLDDWLTGVRTTLRAGGRLLISEHHPFWETMGVASERQLTVLSDYFGKHDLPVINDASKSAIGTAETADNENSLRSFVWGVGTLVSTLTRHDFEILALQELPYRDMFRGLGEAADCVPAVYRLMASVRNASHDCTSASGHCTS